MSRIIRRILVIIPAVALEVLWILALLTWLRPWAGIIETSLSVLSVVFVFYIIMKQDEGTYKILWLIIILFSPIVGALLYLLFGNKRTTRPLRKALEKNPLLPIESETLRKELDFILECGMNDKRKGRRLIGANRYSRPVISPETEATRSQYRLYEYYKNRFEKQQELFGRNESLTIFTSPRNKEDHE